MQIKQLMSPQNVFNLIKKYDYYQKISINIQTNVENATKIDECMSEINEIYGESNTNIRGYNHLPKDISNLDPNRVIEAEDITAVSPEKVSMISMKKILKLLLYSFTIIVGVISIVNTFNAIYASITLRRKEIAELKSIGMSNKQIRKMICLEGTFYGAIAGFFGILISIIILYIFHIAMFNAKVYFFTIPLKNIIGSIIVMYIVIFFAIIWARSEHKENNIIEEIRKETI